MSFTTEVCFYRTKVWFAYLVVNYTLSLDTLPSDLNVKLRVNRRDMTLPDSHGQIWMQLVLASKQDPDLLAGTIAVVKQTLIEFLSLQSETRFPILRLITLWNNHNWNSMATRWCEAAIGKDTFNITIWERMARSRLDNVSSHLSEDGNVESANPILSSGLHHLTQLLTPSLSLLKAIW